MARLVRATLSLAAAVRVHFGLTQAELAAFIGVSRANLAHVEAGRKQLGPAPDQRLQVLARQLPPPDGHGPPAPAFDGDAAAPAATGLAETEAALAPLRQRLARCQWLRTQLQFETSQQRQPGQARHLRRLWAVRVLEPALAQPLPGPDWLAPSDPAGYDPAGYDPAGYDPAGYDPAGHGPTGYDPAGPLPPYPLATPDAARDTHWLSGLALRLAAATPPLPPGAAALARARLAGLDAEIQALEAALGAAGGGG